MSRLSLRALMQRADQEAVRECVGCWVEKDPPVQRRIALAAAAAAMEDEQLVLRRMGALPRKLQDLLEVFFSDGGAVRCVKDLFEEVGESFKSRFDLEATLAALHREGFLWPATDKRWAAEDSPACRLVR